MNSSEIRSRFLAFFEARGHKIVPSAPLVPENDPSVLFNTAGMQPLAPYLLGQKHPLGNRLASTQKCVRTGDIEEVGNNKNLTFFEMLGNWSLGDYFKEEAISWSYEFLTHSTEGLGLQKERLYVTVFEGDENAPRDLEALEIWKKFIPENRIYFLPAKNNWWSPGENGPCGPDTEMFYDVTEKGLGDMTHDEYVQADDRGDVVEIWNDVFMEYEKVGGKVIGKLSQKNVDTGSGLERITMLMQGKSNVYETDLFRTVMEYIETHAKMYSLKSARIIADHIRAAVFIMGDGVIPSSKDRGYILRRLIRRAMVQGGKIGLTDNDIEAVREIFVSQYASAYPEIAVGALEQLFIEEMAKFRKTLDLGMKEFEKGTDLFTLATTYGFPFELALELAEEKGLNVDKEDFNKKMEEHQNLSRTSSAGMFKGGLANHNEKTIKLHTTHHLLLAALQEVLGKEVKQRGSNITEERLRIDFTFDRKMTDEEKKRVEDIVNQKISEGLQVCRREMPLAEAEKIGAEMEFGAKYPEMVSVYFIEDKEGNVFSKEFCGGPHVESIRDLGVFKIQKEEASSQGVRRIKATLF